MMEPYYPVGLAGLTAGILTYCDLTSVFDAPPLNLKWKPWFRLQAWWWGFILANSALACVLYYALRDKELLNDWSPSLAALLVGASYTALVRLKITTIDVNGKNTPFGLETIYEAVKGIVHKRINGIIRVWRMEQCEVLSQTSLPALRDRALLMVGSDSLLTSEERASTQAWIEQTANDAGTSAADKRRTLALYIITEQRAAPRA